MRLAFDHGTLVLEDAPDISFEHVPFVKWDPRVQLYRAPAHSYPEVRRALCAMGLRFVDEVQAARSPSCAAWDPVALRPYQRAAVHAWELAGGRGVVALPTGSGKTRVALEVLRISGQAALCMVPTRVLLHQWVEELGRFYGGSVGLLGDGVRKLEAVTVATFESAFRLMPTIGAQFGLVVVDEVHHLGFGTRHEALEMCTAERRLGLTATPPEGEALDLLNGIVGPIVQHLSLEDLRGRWLADFDLVVLRLALDPDENEQYQADYTPYAEISRAFRRQHPHATFQELMLYACQTAEGRAALAGQRRARKLIGYTRAKAAAVADLLARHRESRVLVFTGDNAAAYAIAREHLVMPITCEVGRAERARALEAFRKGYLRVLVSARVLNEGVDVPDADVAIIVGGTQGSREHVQRIGRLLRPVPGKRAVVYELVTTSTAEVWHAQQRRRGLASSASLSG
jgi:superfamily II DNA or RNA helicase